MLPIMLDRDAPQPLAQQIAAQIREFIHRGRVQASQPLPSSRALARALAVSRGTVVAAYDQLIAEGYLEARAGSVTRVHTGALSTHPIAHSPSTSAQSDPTPVSPVAAVAGMGSALLERDLRERIDLRPEWGGPQTIDESQWREAWREAATTPNRTRSSERGQRDLVRTPEHMSDRKGDPAGLPEAREAIADHLRVMRALPVTARQVVITAGAREGLALLVLAASEQLGRMGVESPGFTGLHRVLREMAHPRETMAVDAAGVLPQLLPQRIGSALITPNHLYPAGGAMPAHRRLELLHHAGERSIMLIEDDLDADHRHLGPPLPTLWELNPDLVAHIGTFSQVLATDVRMGYLIVPPRIHSRIVAFRQAIGSPVSHIDQRALTFYLSRGGLRRRIVRQRREITRRRELVISALSGLDVELTIRAHAVIQSSSARFIERILQRAQEENLLLGNLRAYWDDPGGSGGSLHGIVLNYSSPKLSALSSGLHQLRSIIDGCNQPRQEI